MKTGVAVEAAAVGRLRKCLSHHRSLVANALPLAVLVLSCNKPLLAAKGRRHFAYTDKKLAGSRLYAENKTLGSRVKVHAEINDMHKALFGKVPDRWLWNYTHAVVEEKLYRSRSPRWFDLYMLIVAMKAALHWNGRIAPEMKTSLIDHWRRFRNRSGRH
jgi:hypothetical protein